jgi:undecaprenyl-diphosphatase
MRGAWAVAMQGSALAWQEFLIATALAAVAGWACIAVFLALLKRLGLMPFIVYRIALGLLLLGIAF